MPASLRAQRSNLCYRNGIHVQMYAEGCTPQTEMPSTPKIRLLRKYGSGYNVLQLGEMAEIEVQMFSFAQKFNRRTAVEFSTEAAILPKCCYLLPLLSVAYVVCRLSVGKKHTLLQAWLCRLVRLANV